MRNQNSDLQMLHSVALPLIHRDCGERGPVQSSYMTHILHTARIGNINGVMFVNRIRKMGSFELDKEIEKHFFFVLSLAWDKEKNFKSPWGIEPQTFGFRAPVLYHWSTETLWLVRLTLWSLYMTFGDSEVFLWPMLLTRQKTYYSISLLSSKLPIFLILRSLLILLFLSNAHWIWGEKTMYQLFHRNIHLFSF